MKSEHPEGAQLSAYLDGMADVARVYKIARHLRTCTVCRTELSGLAQTRVLLRQMPSPAVPGADFWAGAYRRLRVDDRERAQARVWPWDGWRAPGRVAQRHWAAGLTAAVALVGMALVAPKVGDIGSLRPLPMTTPAAIDDAPNVSSLVRAHAASVANQPFADPDRQAMISYDAAFDADSDDAALSNTAEAAADADSAP